MDKMISSAPRSALIELFLERSGNKGVAPESVINNHVRALHNQVKKRRQRMPVEHYLSPRNIKAVDCTKNQFLDGFLEPIGKSYLSGFKMYVNPSDSATRRRFTMAHEICHTFFYEFVPEIKFCEHSVDPTEEYLCNIGAAELLMPEKSVRRIAEKERIGLKSLDSMAEFYGVSREAMLIRLTTLRIWDAILSVWQRTSSGLIKCVSRHGAYRSREWTWAERDVAREVWSVPEYGYSSGPSFIEYMDGKSRCLKPVQYESQRCGDRLIVIWGPRQSKKIAPKDALFKYSI